MKKFMFLRCDLPEAEGKKLAREIKKGHEALWGKGTCNVVVIPSGADLVTVCEDWGDPVGGNRAFEGCSLAGCGANKPESEDICGDDDQPMAEND